MPMHMHLRFWLLAMLVGGAIILLIALQPLAAAGPAAPPAPATAATGAPAGPGGDGHPAQRRHPHPENWRGQAFVHRPYDGRTHHFVPPSAAGGDFGVDGWRLLAALALTGGLTGLLWAAVGHSPDPVGTPAVSVAEQDVALLRAELGRLEREQRHLRETLDWQARLLAEVSRPELPPDG